MKMIVYYNGKNIYAAEGLRFEPGINEIPLEAWQRAQRNKLFVKRLDDGILQVQKMPTGYDSYGQPLKAAKGVKGEALPAANESNYSLAGLNAQQAKEIIGKTVNVELLESWNEQEDRKGVSKLISDRIAELEKLTSPKVQEDLDDEDDDEDGDE